MTIPSGTITFLFTDIEGSTALWENYPDAMGAALERHDNLIKQIVLAYNGYVFKTTGMLSVSPSAKLPMPSLLPLPANRLSSTRRGASHSPFVFVWHSTQEP